jgi:NTP pyrophosphatase (non-canonical NTP hydrolase)
MFDAKLIDEILLYNNCKYESISNQRSKITEEYLEFIDALIKQKYNPSKENKLHLAEESIDLMQATYTFLSNNYTKEDVENAIHRHLQKLIDRDNEVK